MKDSTLEYLEVSNGCSIAAAASTLLLPGNNDPWVEVRDTLNRSPRGWSNFRAPR